MYNNKYKRKIYTVIMNKFKREKFKFSTIIKDASRTIRSSSASHNYQPTNYIHRNTHYEILVIKKGGGTHNVDFIEYPVLDNQLFFLRPGQMHQFSPTKETEFSFIAIDNNEIKLNNNIALSQFSFFQSLYAQGYHCVDDVTPIINAMNQIQTELNPTKKKQVNQDILISSYTVILLIQIQQLFDQQTNQSNPIKRQTKQSDLVDQFNTLIDCDRNTKRFVKDYANELFVNPNYLNEKIKMTTGYSASYWINQSLIINIKKALLKTSKSLGEIALEFNFPNSTHLIRFFKKQENITPLAFRKQHKVIQT
jgi:AraC family transcriptional activator of pobA